MIRIHPFGEDETPSSPIRRHAPDAKYPDEMCRMQDIRVESARQPDGMAAQSGVMAAAAGCKLAAAGWNGGAAECKLVAVEWNSILLVF